MNKDAYEWDWGKELDEIDSDLEKEWKNIDRQDSQINWEKIQEGNKKQFADLLMGELGTDIKNVTSGRVKVKLTPKMKIKRWIERFFKMF